VTSLDLESPTSDEMWANRIYYLLAKVVNFSFGRSQASDELRRKEGKELEEALERWRQNLPPGFQPFWYAEADEGELNPFPSICEKPFFIYFKFPWLNYGYTKGSCLIGMVREPSGASSSLDNHS
jgi:hypothetical protein